MFCEVICNSGSNTVGAQHAEKWEETHFAASINCVNILIGVVSGLDFPGAVCSLVSGSHAIMPPSDTSISKEAIRTLSTLMVLHSDTQTHARN